jgi:hypothetical protein
MTGPAAPPKKVFLELELQDARLLAAAIVLAVETASTRSVILATTLVPDHPLNEPLLGFLGLATGKQTLNEIHDNLDTKMLNGITEKLLDLRELSLRICTQTDPDQIELINRSLANLARSRTRR